MERPVTRRTESHFRGACGQALYRRAWLPAAPECALVLVHGFAEHSGRYEHVGSWLARRGCAVHAYDQQGHGRSEGLRGHVRRFGDLLDDLEIQLQHAAEQHPQLPLFLLGHSMGGLVVASFVRERRPALAGAITSGAALALAPDLSRTRLLLSRWLRRIAPRLTFESGIDAEGLSRDPEVVRAYREDPLVFSRLTTSLAAELLAAVQRAAGGGAAVSVPMLMLHGGADPIAPAEGSRVFHAGIDVAGSALRIYPELRHEIFNEPEREMVFEDVLGWLRERAGLREAS